MKYDEIRYKSLCLIEEVDPESEYLTDDPDLAAKHVEVTNQVMFEMARIKKIPKYVEIPVSKGDVLTLEDIGVACGYEIYQVSMLNGVDYVSRADGTVYKILENGVAEIDVYVYPERITEKTKPRAYEFELSADALEVLPYGIAADLLKSDESAGYGKIYAERYEAMLRRLDPRYKISDIVMVGGVRI